jgi:hypothetical protein
MKKVGFCCKLLGISLGLFTQGATADWQWSEYTKEIGPGSSINALALLDATGTVSIPFGGGSGMSVAEDGSIATIWVPAAQVQAAILSGDSWSDPAALSDPRREAVGPAISIKSARQAAAIWYRYANNNVIESSVYSGGSWSEPVLMSNPNVWNAHSPSVSFDTNGIATAAWSASSWNSMPPPFQFFVEAIQASSLINGIWTSPQIIGSGSGATLTPYKTGGMMATWYGNSNEVMSAVRINGTWQSPQTIGAGASLSVAIGGDDVATAVWLSQVSANQRQVVASRYIAGAWGDYEVLSGPVDSEFIMSPRVAANSPGEVVAMWTTDNGKNTVVQSSRLSSGRWSQPITLSNQSYEAQSGAIVLDDAGDATAVWSENRPNGPVILARRGSASARHPLAVTKQGYGSVTSYPNGIDCGQACTADFGESLQVSLMPVPDSGYSFYGWSGDCSGSTSCVVTMNSAKNVSAIFAPNPPPPPIYPTPHASLMVAISKGHGSISSDPVGIDCGSTCSYNFTKKTKVRLTATPAAGMKFNGWSGGGCSGKKPTCTVSLKKNVRIKAKFK